MSGDKVTKFPGEKPIKLFIGPFTSWKVVIEGRLVPRLSGREDSNGTIWLTVDHRFSAPFKTIADAHAAAVLVAQATAIAAGYPHFGAESRDMPFAPKVTGLVVSSPKEKM